MSRITELGINSSLSTREADELERLAVNKHIVEIGSLLGYSTIKMATVAQSVIAIDPHRDYPSYNPAPTLSEFLNNIGKHGVYNKVVPIIAKAQKVLPLIRQPDMVFIDATGTYIDTKFCLANLYPEIMAVHDYGRRSCDGATRAVDEFVEKFKKQIRVIDTLAIIA